MWRAAALMPSAIVAIAILRLSFAMPDAHVAVVMALASCASLTGVVVSFFLSE